MKAELQALNDSAALWVLRQEDPDWTAEQQAELDAWLAESTGHRVAFLRLRKGWQAADRSLTPVSAPDQAVDGPAENQRHWGRWLKIAVSLAAAVIMVLTLETWNSWYRPQPLVVARSSPGLIERPQQALVTPLGGHAIVPLSDGSRLELNTNTAVRTSVSPDKREIWLDNGEAFFEVAHRAGLPFTVYLGDRTLTVLGTKFVIRRDRDVITVAVAEGRVQLDDLNRPDKSRSAVLSGGDMAYATETSMLVTANVPARVERALAWRHGMLSFADTPLSQAAAEFNRYNRRRLIVTDDGAAAIKIDGAFQSTNVEAFSRLLQEAYGLRVTQNQDMIKISR